MDQVCNIIQEDLFRVVFCDIGHDLTDAAVVFFILTGWKSCPGDRIFIQDLPEVLQSGDDLKFIHGFPATVRSMMSRISFMASECHLQDRSSGTADREKLRRIGSVYFWKRRLPENP